MQLIWTNVHINSMGSLLVSGWTPFCFQNCLNSSWYKFNNELKAFGPYSHDYGTQSTSTTSLLYWIEIYLLWRTFEYSALAVMFEKPAWHDVSFVCSPAGCCHQKWHLNDAQLRDPKCAKKISHYNISTSTSLNCRYKAGQIHSFDLFIPNSDPSMLYCYFG